MLKTGQRLIVYHDGGEYQQGIQGVNVILSGLRLPSDFFGSLVPQLLKAVQ